MKNTNRSHQYSVAASQLLKEKEYWLHQLSGELVKSSFPYDYPPKSGERHWESFPFQLAEDVCNKLIKLSGGSDKRLFMILVAVLTVLVHQYTSYTDIILGTPTLKQEFEAEFINTVLILRTKIEKELTCKELLLNVRQTIIEATEHQNYPVETLPNLLNMAYSETEGFPLVDIVLLLKNIHDKKNILHIAPPVIFSFRNHDGRITAEVEFDNLLYNLQTVERISQHLCTLLENFLGHVDGQVAELEILSDQEKQKLLIDFNHPHTNGSSLINKTLLQMVEEQATKEPDNTAVVDINGTRAISYGELNRSAAGLAALLESKGVQVDQVVGIMVERSITMVIAMLAVLKAGGAYLPFDTNYPAERVQYMLRESGPELLLIGKKLRETLALKGIENIDPTENILQRPGSIFHTSRQPLQQGHLFYVIYTSGSTGKPKGILITHRGFANLILVHHEVFGENNRSRVSQVASPSFDAMASEIWTCLAWGGALYFVGDEIRTDSKKMKEWLIEKGITISYQPTILAEHLLKEKWPMEGVALQVLRTAGDKLTFYPTSSYPFRFYNLYGPTEDTVWTTWAEIKSGSRNSLPPHIGKPIPHHYVYILAHSLKLQPIGIPGELCIGGIGLARGYLNRPELTLEKFLFLSNRYDWPNVSKKLYKTGDLAKWLPDGNIQFLTRIDSQVKIRGFRIELGEIEIQLMNHTDIENAVVIVNENEKGNKNLFCYLVSQKEISISTVREYLLKRLPDYMVPAYFVQLDKIPLTPSGKTDRKKLIEMNKFIKYEAEYLPPRNPTERGLVEIWKNILDLEQVGIHDNFFLIGGDSIKTITLLNRINETFETAFKAVDLYENETIEKIARKILQAEKIIPPEYLEIQQEFEELKDRIIKEIKLREEEIEDIYPLSDIEKGMILYTLRDKERLVYYNQMVFVLKEREFDAGLLRKSLNLLVQKHSILRTAYATEVGEEPIHIVYKFKEELIDYEHCDIARMEKEEQEEYIRRILKESRGQFFVFNGERPLWRIKTFVLDEENICFCWGCHHAMIDGWSSASLMTELNNIYGELKKDSYFIPQALKSSYKNFVIQQIHLKKKGEIAAYWKRDLDGYKRFEFPAIANPPLENSGKTGIIYNLGQPLLEELKKAADKYNTGIKDLCFAAYAFLLSVYSYNDDIVVGLVSNNRPVCADGEKIIGCFLNTVPVRLHIPVNIRWKDFIGIVSWKLLELKRYDMLSLFEIVRAIGEQAQEGNPLVDMFFNYIDFHIYESLNRKSEAASGNTSESNLTTPYLFEDSGTTNTILDFSIDTTLGGFRLNIQYSPLKLDKDLVHKLYASFVQVLNQLIYEPEGNATKDGLMTEEEKQKILYDFNGLEAEYPGEKRIHQLFTEQVERTPDNLALQGCMITWTHGDEGSVTYKELNEKSNRLAGLLIERGIQLDSIVGLMIERSIEMIIGILGILKAGAAYLPIDPGYPRARIDHMLKDSDAESVVTTANLDEEDQMVRRWEGKTIFIEETSTSLINSKLPLTLLSSSFQNSSRQATSLAYIIYTSGSTGTPKGVGIEHFSLVNRLLWMQKKYPINKDDTVLQKTTYTFDVSVWEILWWSIVGAKVYVLQPGGEKEPGIITTAVERNHVSVMHFVPSMLSIFLEYIDENGYAGRLSSLKQVIASGEALKLPLVERFNDVLRRKNGTALANLYGPTEATIDVCFFDCPGVKNIEIIPIGKPIENICLYILDKHFYILPIGVSGELCIAGVGLARGYINRPELTMEKFLPFTYRSYKSHMSDFSKKVYRTSDLARWLWDGNIEFIGRIDYQVKIRGFRVELGEIEIQLMKYDGIQNAIVVLKDDHLRAYIVTCKEFDTSRLREYLSQKLPDYMVPSSFFQVEKIPLTSNGKVDRKLLDSYGKRLGPSTTYIAPENDTQKKIMDIWKQVLKLDKIGINDNYFELGGTSFDILKINKSLKEVFQVEIPIPVMFRFTTIYSIEKYLNNDIKGISGRAEELKQGKLDKMQRLQKRREGRKG